MLHKYIFSFSSSIDVTSSTWYLIIPCREMEIQAHDLCESVAVCETVLHHTILPIKSTLSLYICFYQLIRLSTNLILVSLFSFFHSSIFQVKQESFIIWKIKKCIHLPQEKHNVSQQRKGTYSHFYLACCQCLIANVIQHLELNC